MPRYNNIASLNVDPNLFCLPTYPCELLCTTIQRALIEGVPPDSEVSVMYDDDESYLIDPNTDITTDRFLVAELDSQEYARSVSNAMTAAAESTQVLSSDEPLASANNGKDVAPLLSKETSD